MIYQDIDVKAYSIRDILLVLAEDPDIDAHGFASGITGISADEIIRIMSEENIVEKDRIKSTGGIMDRTLTQVLTKDIYHACNDRTNEEKKTLAALAAPILRTTLVKDDRYWDDVKAAIAKADTLMPLIIND